MKIWFNTLYSFELKIFFSVILPFDLSSGICIALDIFALHRNPLLLLSTRKLVLFVFSIPIGDISIRSKIIVDGNTLEEPNPDFCQPYKTANNHTRWKGYCIDSIMTFLNDTYDIINGIITPNIFEGKRPTFKDALISTAVIEAAINSLADNGNWKPVEGL